MKKTIFAMAIVLAVMLMAALISPAAAQGDKVYVCKYVGQPNVDERLQTGQNPIEVSVNAIKENPVVVGSYFADAQGRSYVLGFVPMVPEPTAADCPVPTPPVDVCPNLEGNQATMPEGYQLDSIGNCVLIPPPPIDLCSNIEGNQETMPAGYEDPDHDKVCTLIPPPPVDLCTNIEGNQETMPAGYEDPDHDKVCTLIPPTPCSITGDWVLTGNTGWVVASDGLSRTKTLTYNNFDANSPTLVCHTRTETQTENLTTYCHDSITGQYWPSEVPAGATLGACVPNPPPVDVCPNIPGDQATVPDGMIIDNHGHCVTPPPPPVDVCPNIHGNQATVPDGMIIDTHGHCVTPPPPPVDVCLNIWGHQETAPSGYWVNSAGNCVPIQHEKTPIPPPVTGGEGAPGGSVVLPIAGVLGLLTILGLALKPRKVIGPPK